MTVRGCKYECMNVMVRGCTCRYVGMNAYVMVRVRV